jgi:hypothetical protein
MRGGAPSIYTYSGSHLDEVQASGFLFIVHGNKDAWEPNNEPQGVPHLIENRYMEETASKPQL